MEDNQSTNRVAVWIGAKLGSALMLITFILISVNVVTSNVVINNRIYLAMGLPIAFIGPGILFGIAGALIGKYWRRTKLATEIGAVIGTILGIATIGLFLGIAWLALTGNWGQ